MEELRDYLEKQIEETEKEIDETTYSDSSVFLLHERVETYKEILEYIEKESKQEP